MDKKENDDYNSLDSPQENDVSFFSDLKSALGMKDSKEESKADNMADNKENDLPDIVADLKNPMKKRGKYKTKQYILGTVLVLILSILWIVLPFIREPKPPAPDVVASYNGKNITIDDLKSFLAVEGAREREHYVCDVHGLDHSQCDTAEECEKHPIDSLEGYREVVSMMATEQIIQEWAQAKGITQREDVQHDISDLFDYANVEEVVNRISEQQLSLDSISKLDIQLYFDENKEKYAGRTLDEAEDEIRQILLQKKEEEYFPEYIEELKKMAGLKVDYELLKVTEPSDEEIKNYYNQNLDLYKKDGSLFVSEIIIPATSGKEKADEALRKIRSGESFEAVAQAYAQNQTVNKDEVAVGSNESEKDVQTNRLNLNEISNIVENEDGSFSILRLDSKKEEGTQSLKEVKDSIKKVLLQEKMEKEYELRADEALFTVHGRRYTLGDFYQEFKELPETYREAFSDYENRKMLVDQLIVKELLLEENDDMANTGENNHDLEELKIEYLSQILHEEEVDQKIEEPTEEEMSAFYKSNTDSFVTPEKVKLSIIWIAQTQDNKGSDKAKEALATIKAGTSFAEVAKQYSEDGTAEDGGAIDEWFYSTYLPEELSKEIFSLDVGEVSKVIESHGGLYIVQVNEKEAEKQLTYEEAKDTIREHLKEEKHHELSATMEKTILEESNFMIYDRTIRKMLNEQKGEK